MCCAYWPSDIVLLLHGEDLCTKEIRSLCCCLSMGCLLLLLWLFPFFYSPLRKCFQQLFYLGCFELFVVRMRSKENVGHLFEFGSSVDSLPRQFCNPIVRSFSSARLRLSYEKSYKSLTCRIIYDHQIIHVFFCYDFVLKNLT